METLPETCKHNAESLHSAFPFLSRQEANELCPFLEMKEWPSDSVIMQDGDVGDFMGFLVSGRLAVKRETSFSGKFILVAILEKGSMLGEIAVVEEAHRQATVVAIEPSVIFVLTRSMMDLLLQENPQLGIKILKRIVHVLSQRLKKASDRLAKLL